MRGDCSKEAPLKVNRSSVSGISSLTMLVSDSTIAFYLRVGLGFETAFYFWSLGHVFIFICRRQCTKDCLVLALQRSNLHQTVRGEYWTALRLSMPRMEEYGGLGVERGGAGRRRPGVFLLRRERNILIFFVLIFCNLVGGAHPGSRGNGVTNGGTIRSPAWRRLAHRLERTLSRVSSLDGVYQWCNYWVAVWQVLILTWNSEGKHFFLHSSIFVAPPCSSE